MSPRKSSEGGPEGQVPGNSILGDAEASVQAQNIHGDVNINVARPPESIVPRQLPPDVFPFINRQDNLFALSEHLAAARRATAGTLGRPVVISAIAGEAGVGKTALAVHWAHQVRRNFPDGDLYVNLRGYDELPSLDAWQALDQILRSLNVPSEMIPEDLDSRASLYRSLVNGKQILIILDNASHPEQVRPLLPGSQPPVVLVTSRSRLSGLVIRDGATRMELEALSTADSLELLSEVIGADRVNREPQAAVQLVAQCAHLPLALRIVAERAALRPGLRLADLSSELEEEHLRLDGFSLDGDALSEIRIVLSWSYRALNPENASMFRLLGLHAGPDIGLAAAAAMAGTTTQRARRLLDGLVALHLVQEAQDGRYRFHDLIRAFSLERLEAEVEEGVRKAALRRICLWYLETAYAAYRVILPQGRPIEIDREENRSDPLGFTDLDTALAWCQAERVNILECQRQAADWDLLDLVWKIAIAMMAFLERHSYLDDWIESHKKAVSAALALGNDRAAGWVSLSLGDAYWLRKNHSEALDSYTEAMRSARKSGDRWTEGFSQRGRGLVYQDLGRYREAVEKSETAFSIFQEIGERRGEGMALLSIASGHRQMGNHELCHEYYTKASLIFRELGNRWSQSLCEYEMGMVDAALGRYADALRKLRHAVDEFFELGDHRSSANALKDLGSVQLGAGHPDSAGRAWREALELFAELGDDAAREELEDLMQALSPGTDL